MTDSKQGLNSTAEIRVSGSAERLQRWLGILPEAVIVAFNFLRRRRGNLLNPKGWTGHRECSKVSAGGTENPKS